MTWDQIAQGQDKGPRCSACQDRKAHYYSPAMNRFYCREDGCRWFWGVHDCIPLSELNLDGKGGMLERWIGR